MVHSPDLELRTRPFCTAVVEQLGDGTGICRNLLLFLSIPFSFFFFSLIWYLTGTRLDGMVDDTSMSYVLF